MPRTLRSAFLVLLVIALPIVWLVTRPEHAHAQDSPRGNVRGQFALSVLADGAGWIITDTQTGAFEIWSYDPSGPAYQVRRAQYGGTAFTVRIVPAPRPER